MMMMMMMTIMTNITPYWRTKTHIWEKVLMGIWASAINITNSISLLTSHHISSPHWQNLSQKLTEWRALLKKSLCWWLAPRYWWRYILSILYSWLESLKQCLHLCCQISNSNHPDEITASFRRFGPLVVDWPHKVARNIYFFILFFIFFWGGGVGCRGWILWFMVVIV